MQSDGYVIAVVGATGAVGREMLRTLEKSDLPIKEVVALASTRSAGKELPFRDTAITVRVLEADAFEGCDFAIFSAGGARSKVFAPEAVKRGCVVVDNSSAWRMDPDVPLVVPEVNAHALKGHKGIIANPNCSTIQMVLPLKALAQHVTLKRVIVSTYQSASGAGQAGIEELYAGTRAALAGTELPAVTFPVPLAFDAIPHIGDFEENGYTTEEQKLLYETRKILELPELATSATCVRVPIERSHLESVTVDIDGDVDIAAVRGWIAEFPGIILKDELAPGGYPVARDASNRPETFVGRLRRDNVLSSTLHFWVVSDNLLKGAAYNAVQIVEALHEQ